jgi:hypothetical protein
MSGALFPRASDVFAKLPIQEPGPKSGGHGLWFLGPIVMTQPEVSQP